MKIIIEYDLNEKEIELLRLFNKEKFIEYRDSQFYTFQEFKNKSTFYECQGKNTPDEDWLAYFNERNGNGTLKEAERLRDLSLIDIDDDAWHLTYKLTEIGKKVLEQL